MNRPWTTSILVPLALIVLGAVSCDSLLRSLRGDGDDATIERVDRPGTPDQNGTATDGPATGDRVGTQALTTVGDSRILGNATAGIEITLPASWAEDTRLHDSAELEASDRERQLYLVVVAENDNDALTRVGLKENAAKYRALLVDRMQAYEGETPTDVAFVGSAFASQYVMRGQVNNAPVVYLHTTVLIENRYYQVVAWTTPTQYEAYRSELQNIVDTFQEISS